MITIYRVLSYIPEPILLWAFPMGQLFNKFKKVHFLLAKSEIFVEN